MSSQRSIPLPEHDEDANPSQQSKSNNYKDCEANEEILEQEDPEQELIPQDKQMSIEETMGIGSRLTVRERRLPSEWWKPWDPSHASAGQVRTVANATQEPHGEPQSYAEACRSLEAQDWEEATRD